MRIAIFDDNLMWTARLRMQVEAAGHVPVLVGPDDPIPEGLDVAIVDLGSARYDLDTLVPRLKAAGVPILGHAGHKETELRARGEALGLDRIATHREMSLRAATIAVETVRRRA